MRSGGDFTALVVITRRVPPPAFTPQFTAALICSFPVLPTAEEKKLPVFFSQRATKGPRTLITGPKLSTRYPGRMKNEKQEAEKEISEKTTTGADRGGTETAAFSKTDGGFEAFSSH